MQWPTDLSHPADLANFLQFDINYCTFITVVKVICIIVVWLVFEWTLLFPQATSMQKTFSWKTLQLRCPR